MRSVVHYPLTDEQNLRSINPAPSSSEPTESRLAKGA